MSALRFLLFPFSILYGIGILIRNFFYSYGIIMPKKTGIATISVGNLSTGGTGKTPFTESLIIMLQQVCNIAVISRGYGRKTMGFQWVETDSPSWQVGDEILQLKQKFPEITMAVCERRIEAARMIEEGGMANLIILDDAYQHREIHRNINILLTTFRKPYFRDFLLPMGDLREFRVGKVRADVIVITKCPPGTSRKSLARMIRKMRTRTDQLVTFAISSYGEPKDLITGQPADVSPYKKLLLVTGIADSRDLREHLRTWNVEIEKLRYRDHAKYSADRVKNIVHKWSALNAKMPTCVITTPKDAVKIREHSETLGDCPVFTVDYKLELPEVNAFKRMVLPRVMEW